MSDNTKHPIAVADPEPDYVPARTTDPDTSKAAAKKVNISGRQAKVLQAFACVYNQAQLHQDMSNDELTIFMGESQNGSVSSRVTELRKKGFLKYSGNKRQSREGSPQRCHIYVADPAERERLRLEPQE